MQKAALDRAYLEDDGKLSESRKNAMAKMMGVDSTKVRKCTDHRIIESYNFLKVLIISVVILAIVYFRKAP